MADPLQKQPWEERIFSFDFSAAMDADASISSIDSITVTLVSSGTPSLTTSNHTISGQTVTAKFVGGTTAQTYTVRVRVIDSTGQKLELDGKVKIKEL